MTFQPAESACAFAWRNYLLTHKGVDENDARRTALQSYLASFSKRDFDHLQVAAVAYLKKLDELGDDRDARLAANEALATFLEARDGRPTI